MALSAIDWIVIGAYFAITMLAIGGSLWRSNPPRSISQITAAVRRKHPPDFFQNRPTQRGEILV